MVYAAVFLADKSSAIGVVFPDFPGCVTQDEGFEKTRQAAKEALGLHITGMRDSGLAIPEKTDMDAAIKMVGENPGAYIVMIEPEEVREEKEEPVRLSISLKPSVLKDIDRAAGEIGLTRSAFVAVAARHYIRDIEA